MIVTVIGYNGNNDFVSVIDVVDFESHYSDTEDVIKSELIAQAIDRDHTGWGTADDIRIDIVIEGQPEILIDNTVDGWTNLI